MCMNLRQKIGEIVKYCGQYQGHSFMIDERNQNKNFDIRMPEEEIICENIEKLRVVLLTGEAGDGKSRILRNITPMLVEYGFNEICSDFSALSEVDKNILVKRLKAVLDGESKERLLILANIGIFMQAVIQVDIQMMEQLTSGREDVFVCNFENRNLAENEDTFWKIVTDFLSYDENISGCEKCPCMDYCAYKRNIDVLLSENGTEAMRTICNAIYLTGGHITFRELLSLLAYTVTFGQDCEERRQDFVFHKADRERKLYYNIFESSNDILLNKVACMDPAKKRGEGIAESTRKGINSKADYIRQKRQAFFLGEGDKYQLLNVDYLVEFYNVLNYMNQSPYNYDIAHDKNTELQAIKTGIKKMGNRGRSDAGLVVTDTPLIFDNQIRTEFMLMQDMSMIWHRYDMQLGKKTEAPTRLWNKFYLSYLSKGESGNERKLISLLIDYKQFKYLMMCSKDYFMNRNELSVEEYAVNTFYRKILQETKQAYDSIVIRFGENMQNVCDFSLMIHTREDIFSEEQHTMIRIKRED